MINNMIICGMLEISFTMRLSWWSSRRRLRQLLLCLAVIVVLYVLMVIYWMQTLAIHRHMIREHPKRKRHAHGSKDRLRDILTHVKLADPLPRPKPPNQWVVVRSYDSRACDLVAAAFSDWNVVVAAQYTASNTSYRSPRCQYLEGDHEADPSLTFLSACMLAIKGGAELIFIIAEGTDLQSVEPPTHAVYASVDMSLVVDSSSSLFNMPSHFGCIASSPHQLMYYMCRISRPAIQVTVTSVCSNKVQRHGTKCDHTAPSVVVKEGLYVPVTLESVLFASEAFWALPLLCASSVTEKYIVSLFVQKLLWNQGSNLMVVSSRADMTAVCPDEALMHEVVTVLDAADCTDRDHIECMQDLLTTLSVDFSLSSSLTNLLPRWIQMLQNLYSSTQGGHPAIGRSDFIPQCSPGVRYQPVVYSQKGEGSSSKDISNLVPNVDLYMKTCHDRIKKTSSNMVNLADPWTQFTDVLLIVVFNNPLYDVIPYVEMIYRSFFPFILYCGPRMVSVKTFPDLEKYTLSFISYGDPPAGHKPGSFNYQCVTLAMNMRYQVAGYLVISDDMVVFPHKLTTFDRHAAWFLPQQEVLIGQVQKLRECRLGMCDLHTQWYWWKKNQQQCLSVVRTMQRLQHSSFIVNKCYRQLVHLTGGQFRLNGAYSDIFYIPSRLQEHFKPLVQLFVGHDVFLEIAVPTIVQCLENPQNVVDLPGTIVWDLSRDQTWRYWTAPNVQGKVFLHPTKWSYMYSVNGTAQHKSVLCQHVLPYMHDRRARFKEWNQTDF